MVSGGEICSFLGGVGATLLVVYRFIASRISPEEVRRIYNKAKKILDDYEKAKEDGKITLEERLKLAEETLELLKEIIKDLER